MISNISIRNFKSLKDLTLSIGNLSIFTGLNGSGKSTLLQSLLLLRQSFNTSIKKYQGLIIQDGDIVSLGKGKDVLYQYAKDEKIEMEITDDENTFFWSFSYDFDATILAIAEERSNKLNECNLFTTNFQYLNTEHLSPQTLHSKNDTQITKYDNIGTKGEFSIHYLAKYGLDKKINDKKLKHSKAKSNSLIHQVDAWMSEISPGTKLAIKEIKDIDYVKLAIQFEDMQGYSNEYQPVNVGFGITYVLPVVLSVLKAKPNDILILENPESHIHPKGQSIIGKLIAYAAQTGVQILVETHSDHLINGIRVAVKEEKLSRENVKLFYFERYAKDFDLQTISHEILIDKNGELSKYPEGFLDEWDKQLMNLI